MYRKSISASFTCLLRISCISLNLFYPVVVQLLSSDRLFVISWTAASLSGRQASLSFTISRNLLKLMCIESMMPINHLSICPSVIPFSCPQTFPASGSFPMRWPFTSGGQSTGASAFFSKHPQIH